MHVQRHSFKVTFTPRSAVKSIRSHISGRSEVEILLMFADGHTSYIPHGKIIAAQANIWCVDSGNSNNATTQN